MLSRNPNDYLIVTKDVRLKVHGESTGTQEELIAELFKDEPKGIQITFWIVAKDGTYSRRYSVDSCPKWIKKVYQELVKE